MKDIKIGIPGSDDGPPADERRKVSETIGLILGFTLVGSVGILLIVAALWAAAWLLANFPGVS